MAWVPDHVPTTGFEVHALDLSDVCELLTMNWNNQSATRIMKATHTLFMILYWLV